MDVTTHWLYPMLCVYHLVRTRTRGAGRGRDARGRGHGALAAGPPGHHLVPDRPDESGCCHNHAKARRSFRRVQEPGCCHNQENQRSTGRLHRARRLPRSPGASGRGTCLVRIPGRRRAVGEPLGPAACAIRDGRLSRPRTAVSMLEAQVSMAEPRVSEPGCCPGWLPPASCADSAEANYPRAVKNVSNRSLGEAREYAAWREP
jgi:hypothetical protein